MKAQGGCSGGGGGKRACYVTPDQKLPLWTEQEGLRNLIDGVEKIHLVRYKHTRYNIIYIYYLELDRIRVELGLLESCGDHSHIDNAALPVVFIRTVDKIQHAFRRSGNIHDLDDLCNNSEGYTMKTGLSGMGREQ